jgi:hypothetical protein
MTIENLRPPERAGGTVQTRIPRFGEPLVGELPTRAQIAAASGGLAGLLDEALQRCPDCTARGAFWKGWIVCDNARCPSYLEPIREPRADEAQEGR